MRCAKFMRRFSAVVRRGRNRLACGSAEVRELSAIAVDRGSAADVVQDLEVIMVAELNILTEWIPEQMEPGTVFILENAGEVGNQEDPYLAVLACSQCGSPGLFYPRQIGGLIPVICGSDKCSAQFVIQDEQVVAKKPN